MEIQVWSSLAGVALGGGLSYGAQLTTARFTARNEERKERGALAEARRAERLELLREFIAATQQGARIAEEREFGGDERVAGDPEWITAARAAVDRIFLCQRMIEMLFPAAVHERTWDYAMTVDRVLWREPHEIEEGPVLWDVLQGPLRAFMAAVRDSIG